MKRLFSNLFILSGVLCLVITAYLFWQRNNPQRLKFNVSDITSDEKVESRFSSPTYLVIEELNIRLPIYPATIRQGKWEATTKGVSYLSKSAIPGEVGNAVLYGHNWKNLLGNLKKAKPNQEIEIVFADGSKRNFKIEHTQTVTPNQTSILAPTTDSRITLYTCTGFLDSKRYVVIAQATAS